MRDRNRLALVLALGLVGFSARGQSPPAPPQTAARVLDTAADLDRQTQDLRSPVERRARWDQAAGLLDGFLRDHPRDEMASLVRFQAAVYHWAEGRSFADQADLSPADPTTRTAGITQLDLAIQGLRTIGVEPRPDVPGDPLAQNVRYRLAQALSDRARLEPEGASRSGMEREAVTLLEPSLANPQLRGFARLLRGELNNRLGQFTQAQIDVEEAERTVPPPDAEALLRAKVNALIGRAQFHDARKLAGDAAKVDPALRAYLTLRVVLAQRRQVPPGPERAAFDAEAFALALPLRGGDRPEATRALLDMAQAIDEPGEDRPLAWWDLLAEGQLRQGNPARAGRLLGRGADRAEATGPTAAATAARVRAGACLFEADKFAESAALLGRVVADESAPAELRGRAGMLIALGKGRALALKQPGASRADFLKALEEQVRRFPDEVATGEARWLLGRNRRQTGQRAEAIALWLGVPRGHARWLESRLAAADALREAVDEAAVAGDARALAARVEEARHQLGQATAEATSGPELVEIAFRVAALELTPEVGRGEAALEACDRILKGGATADQHARARLIRIPALARAGQLIEAERTALDEIRQAEPARLLEPVRLLDRLAGEAATDLTRRRLGMIDRAITVRLGKVIESLPASARDEVRLRQARSHLFAGEQNDARQILSDWGGPSGTADVAFLRDLADTYARLGSFGLAGDAERLRASKLPPGSPDWFQAQYNLALAQFKEGKVREAKRIIDGVAILHPTLGGTSLRERFERLRQKLAQE